MKSKTNNRKVIVKCSLMIIFMFSMFLLVGKESKDNHVVYKNNVESKKLNESNKKKVSTENNEKNVSKSDTVTDEKCLVTYKDPIEDYKELLEKNRSLIEFFARTYKIDSEIIFNDLISRAQGYTEFDENNLGFLKTDEVLRTYENKDIAIMDYFEEFAQNNAGLVNNSITPYRGNRQYVEGLVKYFSSLYPNVDYKIAISIGAAESGYYQAKGMLAVNNVYGGMSGGKLIAHKNIEYGVLQYIRYLNNHYFSKGLNTIEKIGYVYCPTTSESGAKTVSSHWLSLVNKAINTYDNNNQITIEELNNLQNN